MHKISHAGIQRRLIGVVVIAITSFGCLFSIFPTTQQQVFVTEPWQDPDLICGTWWVWQPIDDPDYNIEALIREGIETSELEILMISATAYGTPFGMCGENVYIPAQSLHLVLRVPNNVIADTDLLGDYIVEIVSILENDPMINVPHGSIGLLDVQFTTAENGIVTYWDFPYEQLLDAIRTGLRGDAVWMLGQ